MKTEPNESAYPLQPTVNSEGEICHNRYEFEGLTKREYFAAINTDPIPDSFCMMYLQSKDKNIKTEGKYWERLTFDEKAEVKALWKVKSADALIKALNETQP